MKLFVRRMGQGTPVVVLHGLLGLSDNWITFGRQLATDFEVIIPDLRNHGQSPHDPDFNFPVLAADVLELIRELGFEKVSIVGHSLGGKTAMLFSLLHPECVEKLVIVDISLREYDHFQEQQVLIEAMLQVDLGAAHSRSDVEKQLQESVRSVKLRQFLLKNVYWKDKETLAWRLNLPVLRSSLPSILEGITETGTFMNPVLLVRGGQSQYITEGDLPEMRKKFPRVSVQTIASATHWVHADAPGEFFTLVHDFLIH